MISLLGGLLAFLLPFAGAQSNPSLKPATFSDFSGGLNDRDDPANLKANESPDLLNVIIDEGAIRPRDGYITCGNLPSGNAPTEMYTYSKSDGSNFLIVADNTNIYQTSDCTSWTRIITGQSSANKPNFRTIRNELWFVNGSTWAHKWNGSTTTIIDGSANTPNPAPPRGRYIEFWRERVWIARTSDNPSIVQWSALTDSAGNDITPSTGTGAWPATNAIYVDQDGGSTIYGIKAYRDNLYIFKDNGIWRLSFNNDFDLSVQKTLSSVGSRFSSSIVELDNLIYFVGPDGIYSFDGDNSVRLSDKIYEKFLSIRQPYSSEGLKIWTALEDFRSGVVDGATYDNVSGSLYLSTGTASNLSGIDYNFDTSTTAWTFSTNGYSICGTPRPIFADKATSADCASLPVLEGTYSGCIGFNSSASGCVGGTSEMPTFTLVREILNSSDVVLKTDSVLNTGSSVISTQTVSLAGINATSIKVRFRYYIDYGGDYSDAQMTSGPISIGSAPYSLQYTMREQRSAVNGNYFVVDLFRGNYFEADGVWTSEIYNAVSLSSWSAIDSSYNSNGGSIDFSVRYGSHPTVVSSSAWSQIQPGSLIQGASWQNYVQVMATMTPSVGLLNSPSIDSISINYITGTGGSQTQNIHGGRWKNRYWVTSNSDDFLSSKSDSEGWDTAADWVTGTLIDIDTSTADGFMVGGGTKLIHDNFTDTNYSASPKWSAYPSASWAVSSSKLRVEGSNIDSGNNITSSNTMATGEWIFQHSFDNGNGNAIPGYSGSNNVGMVFQFVDNSTSATSPTNVATGGAYFIQAKYVEASAHTLITLSSSATNSIASSRGVALASHTLTYTGNDAVHNYRITRDYTGLMTVYLDGSKILEATDTAISSSTRLVMGGNGATGAYQDFDNIFFKRPSTATWVGPVTRIIGNVDYGILYGDKTEMNGTVDFMMRAATSAVGLYGTAFTTFSNGQEITFSSDKEYFQTSARIFSETSRQYIASMTVTYVNRSQQTDGNNNMVLVNSRYDKSSWVPYDMMIGPMTIFNDRFYVGSSTGPSVYRMDFGTNDSGQVIPWYWTSRDEFWGMPDYKKDLLQLSVNFRLGTAANAFVGYSRDSGVTWTDKTVNMAGSGRSSKTLYVNGGNGYNFRFRFGSSTIDESAGVLSITGFGRSYRIPD